jgi:hypothetical protein
MKNKQPIVVPRDADPECGDMQPRVFFESGDLWFFEEKLELPAWVVEEPPPLAEQLANLLDFVNWLERRP